MPSIRISFLASLSRIFFQQLYRVYLPTHLFHLSTVQLYSGMVPLPPLSSLSPHYGHVSSFNITPQAAISIRHSDCPASLTPGITIVRVIMLMLLPLVIDSSSAGATSLSSICVVHEDVSFVLACDGRKRHGLMIAWWSKIVGRADYRIFPD